MIVDSGMIPRSSLERVYIAINADFMRHPHRFIYMHRMYSIYGYIVRVNVMKRVNPIHQKRGKKTREITKCYFSPYPHQPAQRIQIKFEYHEKMLFDDYLRVNGCCIAYKCETNVRAGK